MYCGVGQIIPHFLCRRDGSHNPLSIQPQGDSHLLFIAGRLSVRKFPLMLCHIPADILSHKLQRCHRILLPALLNRLSHEILLISGQQPLYLIPLCGS